MADHTPHDAAADSTPTRVVELCVNLDDVTAEVLGHAQQALLAAGALDVWTTAIQMKKQRPGVMLSVLCEEAKRDAMADRVMRETGSFGVRFRTWDRLVLDRRHVPVETPFGSIRVKLGSKGNEVIVAQPEFEDAAALAEQTGVPVREVLDAARAAASKLRGGGA